MTRGFRPVLPVAVMVVMVFSSVLWAQSQGLLDTEPPTLTVRSPGAPPTPGNPWVLDIRVHDAEPGIEAVTVSLDGAPEAMPSTGGSWALPPGLSAGPHEIVVLARDASWSRNAALERLTVDVPAPPPPEPAPTTAPEPGADPEPSTAPQPESGTAAQ